MQIDALKETCSEACRRQCSPGPSVSGRLGMVPVDYPGQCRHCGPRHAMKRPASARMGLVEAPVPAAFHLDYVPFSEMKDWPVGHIDGEGDWGEPTADP